MLSDVIVLPPERAEAMKLVERLRARKGMFDVIYDSSMEICERYGYGLVGPVGEANCQAPAK